MGMMEGKREILTFKARIPKRSSPMQGCYRGATLDAESQTWGNFRSYGEEKQS